MTLISRPGARYLPAENRRHATANQIRPMPNKSHTAGLGPANIIVSIREISRRSKVSARICESFTPAGNFTEHVVCRCCR
jgi:hypothetical protein